MKNGTLVLALALTPLIACEAVDSEDVLTSGMYADLDVTNLGESTRAAAILRVGGGTSNTFVELTGEDLLAVDIAEERVDLQAQNLGDLWSYTADLEQDEAGTAYSFAFERSVDEGAPSSTCTMPAPFELTGPEQDLSVSRSEDSVALVWEGSGEADPMEVIVESECAERFSASIDQDTGSYTIPAGEIAAYEDQEDANCKATLTLRRVRAGGLDTGFGEGGVIHAAQERSVDLLLTP